MKLAEYFPYNSWRVPLDLEFDQPYWARLQYHLDSEGADTWSPSPDAIFRAFELTPLSKVKVVILGQDPYQRVGLACGLAFSVNRGLPTNKFPPSLKNIFKEAGIQQPASGDLSTWAEQGVLLLNTALTVSNGKAGSHMELWKPFTDAVIRALAGRGVIFVLWGKHAADKKKLLNKTYDKIIEAAHPSRASANKGFFGCDHFKIINSLMEVHEEAKIDWNPAT